MARAADRVFVSQSALSLQMKRLEELVQNSLFSRQGRRLSLTPAGESMLGHARAILAANDRAVLALSGDALVGPARLGVVQDFAETFLSGILTQFAGFHPQAQLQVRVGHAAELLERMQASQLDVLLSIGAPDDPGAIRTVPTNWLGDADLCRQEILPLVVLERPCPFRDAALAALERAGRPYRIVLETPSLAALRAAMASGLGITCRTAHFADQPVIADDTLPPLPLIAYIRQVQSNPHPIISQLSDLVLTAAVQF
jgi:DNA-binding transcriptional LysR family regulator